MPATRSLVATLAAALTLVVTSPVGPPGRAAAAPDDLDRGATRAPGPALDAQARLAGADEGLVFAENRGQWPPEVRFSARLGGADLWVTDDGVVYDFYTVDGEVAVGTPAPASATPAPSATRHGQVVQMRFDGGRAQRVTGQGVHAGYQNYLLGNDPARWAAHVPLYDEVLLHEVYPGIDLKLYADGGLPRYDLVLAPGADLDQVRMRLIGADGVTLTAGGTLRMETSLGPIEQRGLLAYQTGPGGAHEPVPSAFRMGSDGRLGFTAAADPGRGLVVDPLIWSTFLGGRYYESGNAVTVGTDGAATVTGYTYGTGFPTTPGAYDRTVNGGYETFVTQLTADGSGLRFSTFLGGAENDFANGIAIGTDGTITVVGDTYSANYPVTSGSYDNSFGGGSDGFVTRLSAGGGSLRYSLFLGGSNYDHARAVALDTSGGAAVVGGGYSRDFPTTPGAYDPTFNGGDQDAFAVRLSADGRALRYSTYLGGAGDEDALAVAVGPDGTATVAGGTYSPDFPTTPGAFDPQFNVANEEAGDAFVLRLADNGKALRYSTFLGGADYDAAAAVVVGPAGTVTVTGRTTSTDFPTTAAAYDTSWNFGGDAFVARLSPDGRTLRYGTYVGGSTNEVVTGLTLGRGDVAVVVGETQSDDYPVTPDALDADYDGGYDGFVLWLSADGGTLRYSTYLGGTGYDYASSVAVDPTAPTDSVIVAGITSGAGFPTTPLAYDTTFNGGNDAFILRLGAGP